MHPIPIIVSILLFYPNEGNTPRHMKKPPINPPIWAAISTPLYNENKRDMKTIIPIIQHSCDLSSSRYPQLMTI